MIKLSSFLLTVLLVGCVALDKNDATLELANLMSGEFKTDEDTEGGFVDYRYRLPALGEGQWLYLQLNSGEDLALYRQRVLQLVSLGPDRIEQRAYVLSRPEDKTDLKGNPQRLAELSRDDIEISFKGGCSLIWERYQGEGDWLWQGVVSPELCIIDSSRRNTQIRIGSETLLGRQRLWQTERGFSLAGEQLFGSKPVEYERLRRLP